MRSLLRSTALAAALLIAPAVLAQSLAPQVFPNPVSSDQDVTVRVTDAHSATVEVIDVLGRRMSTDAEFAAGTYLVRVVYDDGRALEPVPVTVATRGRIGFRLEEASRVATWGDVPLSTGATTERAGPQCDPNLVFGGFNFEAMVGSLMLRPDLTPQSLRVRPDGPENIADFMTCFGQVQGAAFRYVAGEDPGNRPLRILSPRVVGNTSVTYNAEGRIDGAPFTAAYGWNEVFVGSTPAIQFDLDSPFFPGLGLFELIVMDDEVPVHRMIYDGDEGLFVTSNGSEGRINLLRSILLSSIVDGFDVAGGTKPGDVSFVFEFESGDARTINVHAGAGQPIVGVGDAIHITPKFAFDNPYIAYINKVGTRTEGMNRYGLRSTRAAAGGRPNDPQTDAQFFAAGDGFITNQLNKPTSALKPRLTVDGSPFGMPDAYTLQIGREISSLEEAPSDGLAVRHTTDPGGVVLTDEGDYYQIEALIRDQTTATGETVVVRFDKVADGSSPINVTVTSVNGTFSSFEWVVDVGNDGSVEIRQTFPVGTFQIGPDTAFDILGAGATDLDNLLGDRGSTQDFFIGVEANGALLGIYPDFSTPNADINIRSLEIDANQPWDVFAFQEVDEGGTVSPLALTLFGQIDLTRQAASRP
ncbi:MAG: T9SS type A sorting domain-containing protein [Bacteroidota bacterium]